MSEWLGVSSLGLLGLLNHAANSSEGGGGEEIGI